MALRRELNNRKAELREPLMRQVWRRGDLPALRELVERRAPTSGSTYGNPFRNFDQAMRPLRFAFYGDELEALSEARDACWRHFPRQCRQQYPLVRVCGLPPDEGLLQRLSRSIAQQVRALALDLGFRRLVPTQESFEAFLVAYEREPDSPYERSALLEQLILRGRFDEARSHAEEPCELIAFDALRAWLQLVEGELVGAVATWERAHKDLRRAARKRKITFSEPHGLLYITALCATGQPKRLKAAEHLLEIAGNQLTHLPAPLNQLHRIWQLQNGDPCEPADWERSPEDEYPFAVLLRALADHWQGQPPAPQLARWHQRAESAGYHGYAQELAVLMGQEDGAFWSSQRAAPLSQLVRVQAKWERVAEALMELVDQRPRDKATGSRLVWRLKFYGPGLHIEPFEQRATKKGGWTKGRKVALKRLHDKAQELDFVTPHDERVIAHIHPYSSGYGRYRNVQYDFDRPAVMTALAGHPNLFWADAPQERVEVVLKTPVLKVSREGQLMRVRTDQPMVPNGEVVDEGTGRIVVARFDERQRAVARSLEEGLEIPAENKERLTELVEALSTLMPVQAEAVPLRGELEDVPARPEPCVQLAPRGRGLRARVVVRPLGPEGPCFQPGVGGSTVVAEVEKRRLRTERDKVEEARRFASLGERCPELLYADEDEVLLSDLQLCLELLDSLRELGDEVRLEWPEGEPIRISRPRSDQHLRLNIASAEEWFEARGELRTDEGSVIALRELLEKLESSPGRFLPLDDGRFLTLTKALRRRLQELQCWSERLGESRRIHPLAMPALEALTAHAEGDAGWEAFAARLERARTSEPRLPSTLRAELRDYQLQGFRWLARLADWGAGACLADDMGLGKTVQALALALKRAPQGPTLVVAPTSVGMNWLDEARRFAPALQVSRFGGARRQEQLDELGPMQLLVCSFGLLRTESERLAGVRWATVVLDEAQAIKNPRTKVFKAATALQADFRMATTGTPLENHLDELWSIFRFLNPGLLGSLKRFRARFVAAIEGGEHPGPPARQNQARARLRRLILPYVLRRTKAQVLEELPPRTEIVLRVEMGRKEAALYEAMRMRALEELEQGGEENHIRILARITQLRRACCSPRLVLPDAPAQGAVGGGRVGEEGGGKSAKHDELLRLLDELLRTGHKALVFSQFTSHLALVRALLDERDISYQYLDGSTSVAERERRVRAFQAGEGALFLISLRAGGFGLNLTAADYVVHLDPWWNPAVEDQASDRAHRIGQTRPVTVYRLVMRNTIEERIIDLHRRKRELAESVLAGADAAGRLTADELLELLRGG